MVGCVVGGGGRSCGLRNGGGAVGIGERSGQSMIECVAASIDAVYWWL